MALTNEDLLAISQLLDVKFKSELGPVKNDIATIKDDLTTTKNDIVTIKDDLATAKNDIVTIKDDLATAKGDIVALKDDLATAKNDIITIKDDLATAKNDIVALKDDLATAKNNIAIIKDEQTRINIMIENEIRPDVNLLAENYVPAAIRYEKAVVQIDAMQADIDIVKKVVAEHSEKFQKIS